MRTKLIAAAFALLLSLGTVACGGESATVDDGATEGDSTEQEGDSGGSDSESDSGGLEGDSGGSDSESDSLDSGSDSESDSSDSGSSSDSGGSSDSDSESDF